MSSDVGEATEGLENEQSHRSPTLPLLNLLQSHFTCVTWLAALVAESYWTMSGSPGDVGEVPVT